MSAKKVSIIGVNGYTGLELVRLLRLHPKVKIWHLVSHTHHGEKISQWWPHLQGVCDLPVKKLDTERVAQDSDLVFLALPHLESQKLLPKIIDKTRIIDLSADFRLKDAKVYERYYNHPHQYPEGLSKFVYGLPEFYKRQIKQAVNIANPGCFATVAQLALWPLKDLIDEVKIMAITGSSGSGKSPRAETHHPIRNHNLVSYKLGRHQHIPEIIQSLHLPEASLSFVPVSGPFTRGIYLTAFVTTRKNLSLNQISQLFKQTYKKATFVRFKTVVQLAEVVGSNFCDMAVYLINGQLIIQAVIDNLIKGAAGNALQNMNLMFGWPETEGLRNLSPLFP